MKIEIDIDEYFTQEMIKEIAEDELRKAFRRQFQKESDVERVISNLSSEFVFTLVAEQWDGDFAELLRKKIRDALTALRPVSREQVEKVWSPCNFCAGAKYITGEVTAVYPVSETHQQETLAEGDFDFCPVCGRPITDEAVDMMLERWKEALDEST